MKTQQDELCLLRKAFISNTDYTIALYWYGNVRKLGYELTSPTGTIIFSGRDYGCFPGCEIDSDESLAGILYFLTLQKGDTDGDYFEAYTPEQLEWIRCNSCEDIKLIVNDFDEGIDRDIFTDIPCW